MTAAMGCITGDDAVALVQGELEPSRADDVRDHVDSCDSCRAVVAALADMASVRRAPAIDTAARTEAAGPVDTLDTPAAPGSRIADRYVVDHVIGAGGMGVVYAARDTTLDRMIAIKRVRRGGEAAHERLVREARAMARLANPAVVSVFDAGVDGDGAFIAMEYVAGETLRAYLATRRSWRAIVELFAQAARGLAAAHEVGIVHGDFKPDNVLVDRSGRARVADFGLARTIGARDREVGGTPAYMAPEHRAGRDADPAGDEYAFCVSLHEAIYGRRPSTGKPTKQAAPRAIARLIERGLAMDPAARHGSLAAIAAELDAIPRRRKWAFAAALGATIAVAAGSLAWTARGDGDACGDGASELAAVWNGDRATAIAGAIAATRHPAAADVAASVTRALDAYGQAWRRGRRAACEATRTGEQSADLLDRRMRCLDRRLGAMRAAIQLIGELDRAGVDGAHRVAIGLPPIDTCGDRAALLDAPAPPRDPALGVELAAIASEIDRGDAEATAGRIEAARRHYVAATERAERARWPALEAEAHLALGDFQLITGDLPGSDTSVSRAIAAASRGGDDVAVAKGLIALVGVLGLRHAQVGEADRLAQLAESAIVRAGDDPELGARLHRNLGVVYYLREDWTRAREHWERALAIRSGLPGDHGAAMYEHRVNLAILTLHDGKPQEALDALEAARSAHATAAHQNLGAWYGASCSALFQLDRLDEARARCEKALAIIRDTLGPEHPDAGTTEINLGEITWRGGGRAEALPYFERGAAIIVRARGPGHPQSVLAQENRARILRLLGKLDEAERVLAETLRDAEAGLGKDHVRVGVLHRDRAEILLARGKPTEAVAELTIALDLVSRGRGADHADTASIHHRLGDILAGLGRYEVAREHLERAVPIRERVGADSVALGETLSVLGGVLVQLGESVAGIDRLERALSILEAKHASAATIANLINSLGEAYRLSNRLAEATAAYERSREILIAAIGPGHPDVGVAVFNLGEVALASRRPRDALARYDEALAIWQARSAIPDHILAYGFTGRGEALVALGRARDAIEPLERAREIRGGGDPVLLGQTELALAEAVIAMRGDRERARALVRDAAERLSATGKRGDVLRARATQVQRRLK